MNDVLEMDFVELKTLGADKMADVGSNEILASLRHSYLNCAKDLCLSKYEHDRIFGQLCCEVAEHIQSAMDVQKSDRDLFMRALK